MLLEKLTCGFYGGDGCVISQKQTSHKGNKKYYSLQNQCRYFYPHKGIPTKAIKKSMYEQNNCLSFM